MFFYADDFGLCAQGDAAILELLKNGKLDGTSVLLAGLDDAKISALKNLKETKNIRIGLHLDARSILSRERSIEKEEKLSFILISGMRLALSQSLRKRVQVVWREQVSEFERKFGFLPDQLEAHQHLNFHPFLFGYVCQLAEELGIKSVRIGRHNSPFRFWCRSPRAWVINFMLSLDRRSRRARVALFMDKTTDSFFSIDWIFPQREKAEVLEAIRIMASEHTEIIFHPACFIASAKEYEILTERYKQYEFLKQFEKE